MIKVMPSMKLFMLTLIFSLLVLGSRAQVIKAIQSSFAQDAATTLQEKLFVHTDKDTYLPGEILWFKVYCTDATTHQPLDVSKVAYLEILDDNQRPLVQTKINLQNGSGNGSVYIPVGLSNGNYRFRAYTSWMKNFSQDLFFTKKIRLINPLKSPDAPATSGAAARTAACLVRFFPEGGSLVAGISSKVGFKATDMQGTGVAVTGMVLNQQNDTVARFSSFKFGMGNFSFTPAANEVYKAVVKAKGTTFTVMLPQVNKTGYVMTLSDKHNGQLDVALNSLSNPEGDVFLIAHSGQEMKIALEGRMKNGVVHFTVAKTLPAEGITHFTFFNASRQPLCERLYFKQPQQLLQITAHSDQQQYTRRKKVKMLINTSDATDKTASADLSVAVYRVDSLQAQDPLDIFNYLWLGADLKGNIESPDYYFNAGDEQAEQAADNLMLTQGWRRFRWSSLLDHSAQAFSFLPEYHGPVITGRIINTLTSLPAKNILTYLGIPGKRVQLYTALSDSAGNLSWQMKDFYGPGEVVVQTNALIDSTYRIEILSPFAEVQAEEAHSVEKHFAEEQSGTGLPGEVPVPFRLSAAALSALNEHSLATQVLNLYAGSAIRRFYTPPVDSSAFYGKPANTYKLDDFTRFTTMEEDLREYVKEDNIVKSRGRFHIKVLSGNGFLSGDPLVLLDGVPVFNINKVMAVDPLKVSKLEVVPSLYYYGPSEEQGIFSFTTYKGDLGGIELDPHTVVMDYEGLQLSREFYSPVYETPLQIENRIPDFRNLLYWNPSAGAQGQTEFSFYTSDAPGKYVGVVQGIDSGGHAGSQRFTFEVK